MILSDAVYDLSSGNANLTKRVNLKGKTMFRAFGTLVENENRFIEKLQGIIEKLKASEDDLNSVGVNLTSSMQNTASAITQIISNIDSVHVQINQQSESVQETAGAVNEISANIDSPNILCSFEKTPGVLETLFASRFFWKHKARTLGCGHKKGIKICSKKLHHVSDSGARRGKTHRIKYVRSKQAAI